MRATEGKRVKIRFSCRNEEGTRCLLPDRDTLEFVIGDGHTLPSLEKGVLGMQPGERKTIRVPTAEMEEFSFYEEHTPAEPHLHRGMRKVVGNEKEEDVVILPPAGKEDDTQRISGLFLVFDVTVSDVEG